MHILIYHPPFHSVRVEDISYHNINHSSGVSGTETALVELGKYLANQGHRVTMLGLVQNRNEEGGILYLPIDMMSTVDFSSIDVFCPAFFLFKGEVPLKIYNRLPHACVIWVMAQCYVPTEEIEHLSKFFKVIVQCVSPWLRAKYPLLPDTHCRVIENAMNPLFNAPLNTTPEQKAGKWVFHASFERGGEVAVRVFEMVRKMKPLVAQEMHIATYYTPHIQEVSALQTTRPYIHSHGSLSKEALRNLLDKCDYFVYPLVLPQGLVHHDTYGCVVLEAMARGVIVLSWDVACYESVYKGCMIRIEPLTYPGYDPSAVMSTNHELKSGKAVDYFAAVIAHLENNSEIKEAYRTKARGWAKDQLWAYRGKELEAWLQEHVTNK